MSLFSKYLEVISKINDLENCQRGDLLKKSGSNSAGDLKVQWLFHSGMLFSSWDKWWGDFGCRLSEHEGIDITFYRREHNKTLCFDDSIKVPAMDDGTVLNICDDFLAQTIVAECRNIKSSNSQIIFAYAHIIPEKGLKPGCHIQKNDIIANVCNSDKNPQIPSHLHFSCFEIQKGVRPENLRWDLFSKNPDINLINPFFI